MTLKPDVVYEPTRRQRIVWGWRKFKKSHIREDWAWQLVVRAAICATFGLIGWLASHGVTCR